MRIVFLNYKLMPCAAVLCVVYVCCHREDPIILGWQLAEDASHPGFPSSQTLLVSASR